MQVQENYELPFESEFDWRAGLFNELKDMYNSALLDVILKYKEEDAPGLEWKDTDGLLGFAIGEKLPEKITQAVIDNINKFMLDL
jgi:hypothetical protein